MELPVFLERLPQDLPTVLLLHLLNVGFQISLMSYAKSPFACPYYPSTA